MKTIAVAIQGISPLLQHRFSDTSEGEVDQPDARPALVQRGTRREEAEKVVYREPDGIGFYFPNTWLLRSLANAGGNFKMRGTRKSAKYVVPSAVFISESAVPLLNGDGKTRALDFEVDSRPVTIPSTKGRIMRHRPRFDHWSASFTLEIDDTLLPLELANQLLHDAGRKIGVGDYRPEKSGPFGRFQITSWQATNGA